jgi:SAM-dependent methyltransferase
MSLAQDLKRGLKRTIESAHASISGDAQMRIARSGYFRADDVGWICDTFFKQGTGPGTPWDALHHAHMELPDWFQHGLDPFSPAYAEQQHRLWRLVSDVERPYDAATDEKEQSWHQMDPVRTPGWYANRDPAAVSTAADHVLATGMILKHCGLKAGDHALEYGAGFAQTALALARLGVNVDTVDISATFCDFVHQQAEFFRVPLTPHQGQFGFNPRPGQKYKLIWFYESFHHCVDFANMVDRLHDMLAEGGRVILGGEPIVEREYAAVPYPWGVRLHSEVVAVVRRMHWFELGFSEDFLFDLFVNAGFTAERIDCPSSLFGRLYVFQRRPAEIHLGQAWLPTAAQAQWHGPEPDGRWTAGDARLPVDAGGGFAAIELDLVNHHARRQLVELEYGGRRERVNLAPGSAATVRLAAAFGARELLLRCKPQGPSMFARARSADRRQLGVFVRRLRYTTVSDAPHIGQNPKS